MTTEKGLALTEIMRRVPNSYVLCNVYVGDSDQRFRVTYAQAAILCHAAKHKGIDCLFYVDYHLVSGIPRELADFDGQSLHPTKLALEARYIPLTVEDLREEFRQAVVVKMKEGKLEVPYFLKEPRKL